MPQQSQTQKRPELDAPAFLFACDACLVIQKAAQFARTAWVLELAERFGFNLANAFAGNRELLADFFQRVIRVHADTKAHAQHAFFTRCERCQNAGRCFAQVAVDRSIQRLNRVFIFDEIAKV